MSIGHYHLDLKPVRAVLVGFGAGQSSPSLIIAVDCFDFPASPHEAVSPCCPAQRLTREGSEPC